MANTTYCLPRCMYVIGAPVAPASSSVVHRSSPVLFVERAESGDEGGDRRLSDLSQRSCRPVHDHLNRRRGRLTFQQKPLAVRRDVVGLADDTRGGQRCGPKQDVPGRLTRRLLALDGNSDHRQVLRQVKQFAPVAPPARPRPARRAAMARRVSGNGRRLTYTVWAPIVSDRSGMA
jgi:hypothetical protein